jgi:hypothetical protein
MSRRNQPKSQRAPKVLAGLKKATRIAARIAGTGFASSTFDCGKPEDYYREPTRKTLSYGSGYGWMGRHPADLAILLKQAVASFGKLREKIDIQAIAYTGSSGAAIAFPLAIAYELPIIYVRKPNEQSHGSEVECNYTEELENYVIVDDFIATGKTVERVIKCIKDRAKKFYWDGPECIGVFVFDPQHGDSDKFQFRDDNWELTSEVIDVFKAFEMSE